MTRFHGEILEERTIGSMTLVRTRYAAGTAIAWHEHSRGYVSMLLEGRYTEVSGSRPRAVDAGQAIVHHSCERHADYFQQDGTMLNVELHGDASIDDALRALALPPVPPPAVAPARPSWLDEVLARFDWLSQAPVGSAAHAAGIHPAHFARAFHRFVGVTAVAYRRRERVAAASRLLLETQSSLSRIAYASGFSDQSHFTNAFRATSGLSPAAFRKIFAR